jgi:hypothetical protein
MGLKKENFSLKIALPVKEARFADFRDKIRNFRPARGNLAPIFPNRTYCDVVFVCFGARDFHSTHAQLPLLIG